MAYTVEQVAAILQIQTDTVRRLIRSGELVARNISKRRGRREYRIEPKDLAAFQYERCERRKRRPRGVAAAVPTPEQIAERCRKIQDGWTIFEERLRRGAVAEEKRNRQGEIVDEPTWTPPRIAHPSPSAESVHWSDNQ